MKGHAFVEVLDCVDAADKFALHDGLLAFFMFFGLDAEPDVVLPEGRDVGVQVRGSGHPVAFVQGS